MSFLNFQTQPLFNLTEEDYIRIVRHALPVKDTEVLKIYIINFIYQDYERHRLLC